MCDYPETMRIDGESAGIASYEAKITQQTLSLEPFRAGWCNPVLVRVWLCSALGGLPNRARQVDRCSNLFTDAQHFFGIACTGACRLSDLVPRARVVPSEARPLVLEAAVKAARARALRAEWLVALLERDRACTEAVSAGASYRAVSEATGVDTSRLFGVVKRNRT